MAVGTSIKNMTDEQVHYYNKATSSSTWRLTPMAIWFAICIQEKNHPTDGIGSH
jgi:hypothetical protein